METEKMLGENQEEHSNLITKTPEERYLLLSNQNQNYYNAFGNIK